MICLSITIEQTLKPESCVRTTIRKSDVFGIDKIVTPDIINSTILTKLSLPIGGVYTKVKCLIVILLLVLPLLQEINCYAEQYYPLNEGTKWEYQTFQKDLGGGVTERFNWSRKALAPRTLLDKKVIPLQYENGALEFIIEDAVGIGIYARQDITDTKPKFFQPTDYFLKYPLKRGLMRQVKGTTKFLKQPIRVDKTITVETLIDIVTVPAGTFENCIRIKSSGKTTVNFEDPFRIKANVEVEAFDWYAPNVGWIKGILTEQTDNLQLGWPGQQMIHQLIKFTKG